MSNQAPTCSTCNVPMSFELEILATASKTLKTILEQDLQALLVEGLQKSELEVSTGRALYSEPFMMELQ
jgi:hypothetical protein